MERHPLSAESVRAELVAELAAAGLVTDGGDLPLTHLNPMCSFSEGATRHATTLEQLAPATSASFVHLCQCVRADERYLEVMQLAKACSMLRWDGGPLEVYERQAFTPRWLDVDPGADAAQCCASTWTDEEPVPPVVGRASQLLHDRLTPAGCAGEGMRLLVTDCGLDLLHLQPALADLGRMHPWAADTLMGAELLLLHVSPETAERACDEAAGEAVSLECGAVTAASWPHLRSLSAAARSAHTTKEFWALLPQLVQVARSCAAPALR